MFNSINFLSYSKYLFSNVCSMCIRCQIQKIANLGTLGKRTFCCHR